MLSFETCVALKAAGFPQDEQCCRFWTYGDGEPTRFTASGSHARKEWFSVAERPNSDELIAAICERWPDKTPSVGCCRKHVGDYRWIAIASPGGTLYTGDTPVEALAALYLALAKTKTEKAGGMK